MYIPYDNPALPQDHKEKPYLHLHSNSNSFPSHLIHRQNTTASLPPEDRKQLEEAQQKASTQATNAATGVAESVGGAVKGVLDTAGNTVTIHLPLPLLWFFGDREIP